ncbi:ankyrin [Penicillium sp. DV-2018c]|nr:ankyrin [Penicillium sp. DV-2018c]KAJ5566445.1 ankyrin [Penicillium sp. DV-2018c]
MQSISTPLLRLPTEILEMITIELEYASEVNSLSQTCRRLYSIADHVLFKYFAKECSPAGFKRIVTNNNEGALRKLIANGANCGGYLHCTGYPRFTGYPTLIQLIVDKDLSKIAKILVVYIAAIFKDNKWSDDYVPGKPRDGENFRLGLEDMLRQAAEEGSLGVLREVLASPIVEWSAKEEALESALYRGCLASARCLIEDAGVDVISRPTCDRFFKIPLIKAAREGNLEMVKFLVCGRADLKWPDDHTIAESPLYIAAAHDQNTIVQYLIEMGMRFRPLNLIVRGDDIRAILASPEYEHSARFARGCSTVAAACGDQSLFRDIRKMRDSSLGLEDLLRIFYIAVGHGQIPFARYLVGEIKSTLRVEPWNHLLPDIIRFRNVPAFEVLLDAGPPTDPLKGAKRSLNVVLFRWWTYRKHPGLMRALLHRGYLDNIESIAVLKEMFACAFKMGELLDICRVLHISEFSICDILDDPYLQYYERSILQIAALYSSVETFKELLTMHNLSLDPCHPVHCAALVSATVAANIDLLELFFKSGFDVNSLYAAALPEEHHAAETLLIQLIPVWLDSESVTSKDRKATLEYLLDRGAHIDAKSSRGHTALSLALNHMQPELAKTLFNRGADPLLGLESRDNRSGFEQLVQIYERGEHNMGLLDMLQASLKLMVARGYKSHEFLDFMPTNKGNLAHPKRANTPEDGRPQDVNWTRFVLIKELRKHYWRSRYPVSPE